MRHARTGAVQTADRVPFEQLLAPPAAPVAVAEPAYAEPVYAEPAYTEPVYAELASEHLPEVAAPPLDPWTWPEAPDLPSTPTLKRGIPANPPTPRSHARVLPAADQPKRSLPRMRSFRGPSPAERYGLPPTGVAVEPSTGTTATQGPLVGLVAAVVVGASWIALAAVTGYTLGIVAVTLGVVVGAATHRLGRPAGDENIFFAVLWAILGSTVGFFVIAVQANMSALGVSAGEAIAGSRWNDIVNSVVTAPLNWLYVVLSAAVALYLVRRPRRG